MADLETAVASTPGAVSRFKNTERYYVHPADFKEIAVTGTWALEEASNVPELATDDASSTNILNIPFPGDFSNLDASSDGSVDRGARVIGIELMFEVAVSALATFVLAIYKLEFATADGAPTATVITSTTTFLPDGNDGTEVDVHRVQVLIAEKDRIFLDGDTVIFARLALADGTSSDINISGAIWHVERTEE